MAGVESRTFLTRILGICIFPSCLILCSRGTYRKCEFTLNYKYVIAVLSSALSFPNPFKIAGESPTWLAHLVPHNTLQCLRDRHSKRVYAVAPNPLGTLSANHTRGCHEWADLLPVKPPEFLREVQQKDPAPRALTAESTGREANRS